MIKYTDKHIGDSKDSGKIEDAGKVQQKEIKEENNEIENETTAGENEEIKIFSMVKKLFTERFKNISHYESMEIFDTRNFSLYVEEFPEENYLKFIYRFPRANATKLKNELISAYEIEDFRNLEFTELISKIHEKNYSSVFKELLFSLEYVLSIGTNTASAERSFSALKRIKKFKK